MPSQTNTQAYAQSNRDDDQAHQPDDNPEGQTSPLLRSFRPFLMRRDFWVRI